MKYITFLFISGLALLIALVAGLLNFFSLQPTANATIVVPVDPTVIYLENQLAEAEARDRAELDKLDRTLQQQEQDRQEQFRAFTAELVKLQTQRDQLKRQEQSLLTQVEALKSTRSQQQARYQSQLDQARTEVERQRAELQTQLREAQTQLTQLQAQLNP
jgi:hypothetical protein